MSVKDNKFGWVSSVKGFPNFFFLKKDALD